MDAQEWNELYGGLPSRVSGLEARELPDRGRATLALYPGGIDSITEPGKYAIWTSGDATALGLPVGLAGSVEVYAFGNVVEQTQLQHGSAGVNLIGRRRAGGVWSAWKNPGVDDLGIAALVKPGTQTYNAINAIIPTPEQSATKIAAVALSTGDSGGTETVENRSFRYPFKFGADVKRFRVHMQNSNPRYGNRVPGALTFTGLGFSRNAGETVDSTKDGQLTSGWQIIEEDFTTNAFGWEYVSPWVEAPIKAGDGYLLSGGYTCAPGQANVAMVGGGWVTDSAADWNVSNPSGLTLTQSAPLWVWLEVEVDSAVPVIMYFGDSLFSGVSARLGVYDSFPAKHALAHGHIATHYTNSGTKMLDHLDSTHFRWTRYATATNLAKPDGCVFGMGSNDLAEGPTLATMQSRYASCRDIIVRNFTPRIGLVTILPRHSTTGTFEPARKIWNEHLITTLPGGAATVTDSAAALTNPDGSTLDQRFSASPTDIHLTAAGYSKYTQGVPPMHR